MKPSPLISIPPNLNPEAYQHPRMKWRRSSSRATTRMRMTRVSPRTIERKDGYGVFSLSTTDTTVFLIASHRMTVIAAGRWGSAAGVSRV